MSSSTAKKVRKMTEKYIRKGENKIVDDFIKTMKSCSFRTRLKIAWAIIIKAGV